MLERIVNLSFFKETIVAGVYINIHSETEILCQVVVLEKKKASLQIIQKSETPLAGIASHLATNIPMCVVIDGKGILQRECGSDQTDEQLILQAFPNVNPSEYYVQSTAQRGNVNFACFARRKAVDDILEILLAQSYKILNLSLGSIVLSNLAQIKGDGQIIAIPYKVSVSNGQITQIDKIKESKIAFTVIGDESIPTNKVLPFSTALAYFAGNALTEIQSDFLNKIRLDYTYLKLIKKGGLALLMLLFVVLLGNFLLFSSQREKQQALTAELGQYEATISKVEDYKREISEKERFLGNSDEGGNTYFSYYADKIAATKPEGIVLQKMQIFPVTLKNKKFDVDGIKKDTILISGLTRNSVLLNDWTKQLQKQKFVGHVGITNFTQMETNSGSFSLTISLNSKQK